MSEDIRQENTYWSRELADLLQIGNSTLRKWCRLLEAHGYRYIKDEHDRRAFTDHDALALRYFKELTQEKGVSLDIAAKAVVERFSREATRFVSLGDTPIFERYDSAMHRIEDHMKRQEDLNVRLLQELADQRRFIEESLNRRDVLLMQHIRETLEAKKELAVAEEKKKWWRFWRNVTK